MLADLMQCQNLSVPMDIMHHVVQVESSANPYAIGVVGARLVRQPQSLGEAVSTAEMLESRGYNFSVGLSQVNRYNLRKYGVNSYAQAFDRCTNLQVGSKILAECQIRAKGDWGSAFSCYYSGNFVTGFDHGYVQKIYSSMAAQRSSGVMRADAIPLAQGMASGSRSTSTTNGLEKHRGRASVEDVIPASMSSIPAGLTRQGVGAPKQDLESQVVTLNASAADAGIGSSSGIQGNSANFLMEKSATSQDDAFVF
ncbi:lytic transglycosylase domain-containing protein [Pseudoxanthomonas winnipegensis]|jgi:type IV secretion system protein VirB1|uniref:Lytic transglycosylase domain-containing protein n=1 Tax=Pseudoxanthomonas winnipegensis TaxID=2480810 RepID=A0ABY1WB92_9GAMM|nr:lytic transglycosylase domain-containing protein [Pseudoxanthomonas winnipegensis]TAA10823.1 lytic transglycosylase domain-containing protein [Pseudoxanthomonas winnipegensis]TAA18250.1 lytic transglycosylase domain-containing protein [Pseudoxanthomonas winnipegensis]TAH74376.1 lytic transglycosylase domain-containing protein [Pseudoxanthomonas winnipegensis]